MPLQWRLQVLEAQLSESLGRSVRVIEADLFGLAGEARNSALDALTSGADMPFVIVHEQVVHTGELDLRSVVDTITRTCAV